MNQAADSAEHVSNGPAVGDGESLPTDDVFMLLKNRRRRRVLAILREESETTLSDLAERIAAEEHDTEPDRLTSSQRKRVYVSLYQCHLPKLDDYGVVKFDSSRGDVVRGARAAQLEAYLNDDATTVGVAPALFGGVVAVCSLVGLAAAPAFGGPTVWGIVAAVALLGVSGFVAVRDDSG